MKLHPVPQVQHLKPPGRTRDKTQNIETVQNCECVKMLRKSLATCCKHAKGNMRVLVTRNIRMSNATINNAADSMSRQSYTKLRFGISKL